MPAGIMSAVLSRLFALLLVASSVGLASEPVDSWGGWTARQLAAGSRFRLETVEGMQWLVTPDGHPFFGIALAHGNFPPLARRLAGDRTATRFGDEPTAFQTDRDQWMRNAGFNALSYTIPENRQVDFPWIATLPLLPAFISAGSRSPDFYSPEWRKRAVEIIARQAGALADDPRVLGISLGYPVLASPHMMPSWSWERRHEAPTNLLKNLKSLPAHTPGKRAYIGYLRQHHATPTACCVVYGWPDATSWDELAGRDLGSLDDPFILRELDAPFYERMWNDAIHFLTARLRESAPSTLIFSPRIIGLQRWPDPWVEAWLRGIAPCVDAFLPELYSRDAARNIVDEIGRMTGRPSFIADGMRLQEFNYADEVAETQEATAYERLFRDLIGSPWLLGITVCEYQTRSPEFAVYARRLDTGRLGLRHADYTERPELLQTMKRLHVQKYALRVAKIPLSSARPTGPCPLDAASKNQTSP